MRLRERGVLTQEVADALGRAIGLRNVIARDYTGINPTLVHQAATSGLDDLGAFAQQVAAFVQSQQA